MRRATLIIIALAWSATAYATPGTPSTPAPSTAARTTPPGPVNVTQAGTAPAAAAPKSNWGKAWNVLNSQFVSALLAGLAGAGVGAYGGASIVQRQANRKALREEVRAANVAIALCMSVLETTLGMKNQHIRGMVAKYEEDKKRFEVAKKERPEVFEFAADYEDLPVIEVPMSPLKETIYTRLDASGQTYAMCASLAGVVSTLHSAIEGRNTLLAAKRDGPKQTDQQRAEFYFGLRRPDGVMDARYPTTLDALSHYTDATILYSAILAALLAEHGKAIAKKLGKDAPKINGMDLGPAFKAKLMPDVAEYEAKLKTMGIDAMTLLAKYGAPSAPRDPEAAVLA